MKSFASSSLNGLKSYNLIVFLFLFSASISGIKLATRVVEPQAEEIRKSAAIYMAMLYGFEMVYEA